MNQVGSSPAPYNLERPGTPVSGYVFSNRVPALTNDPQQVRLKAGIEGARLGTVAVIKELSLTVDALAIANAAVDAFVIAFQPALGVEASLSRQTGTPANFSAGNVFRQSILGALAGLVAAHRLGCTGVESIAYAGRFVAILSVEAPVAEGVSLRSAALAAAKAIVAAASLDVVSSTLGMTVPSVHTPHSAASPPHPAPGALGRHV